MDDLQFVYDLLLSERKKLMHKIKRVDTSIRMTNTLDREYWKNVRDDFTTLLHEFSRAIDIVWKELHK